MVKGQHSLLLNSLARLLPNTRQPETWKSNAKITIILVDRDSHRRGVIEHRGNSLKYAKLMSSSRFSKTSQVLLKRRSLSINWSKRIYTQRRAPWRNINNFWKMRASPQRWVKLRINCDQKVKKRYNQNLNNKRSKNKKAEQWHHKWTTALPRKSRSKHLSDQSLHMHHSLLKHHRWYQERNKITQSVQTDAHKHKCLQKNPRVEVYTQLYIRPSWRQRSQPRNQDLASNELGIARPNTSLNDPYLRRIDITI